MFLLGSLVSVHWSHSQHILQELAFPSKHVELCNDMLVAKRKKTMAAFTYFAQITQCQLQSSQLSNSVW